MQPPEPVPPRGEEVAVGSAALQGQFWGAAAQDWADLQEPFALPLWMAMMDAAGIGLGTRFLDAGCGAGGASVCAARRGAQVNGFDAAEPMVRIARQRVPDGSFQVGDLEALPYVDHTFDAIIAADTLAYAADPIAALSELRRVCAPGGRIVVAAWGAFGRCETGAIFQAVMDALPSPSPGGWPFAYAAPGSLRRLIERAGLKVIGNGSVTCLYAYPDGHAAWRAQRSAGLLQAALQVIDETALETTVRRALAPYQTSTGSVRLHHHYRYITAQADDDRRPSG
jgi:SAM-dependent methyltransferase